MEKKVALSTVEESVMEAAIARILAVRNLQGL